MSFDRDNGMGVGYIPSSEYESWAKQNRVRLSISELAILKALDRAYVAHHNAKDDDSPKPSDRSLMESFIEIAKPEQIKKKGGKK